MKKNNLKKIFSALTILAITATATCAVAGCGEKQQYKPSGEGSPVLNGNTISVDTALGTVKSQTSGNKYYVSADAESSHVGTVNDISDPYDIFLLLSGDILKPGDIVYVLPGTYSSASTLTISVNGTYQKYISIINAAYDKEGSGYTGNDTLVTLDFSDQVFASTSRGVQLNGNYIYWYGIDVCGAGDNGLYVGGDFNTIEYSEFYNNRDTGLQLGRSFSEYASIDQWPSYNLVKNCTSHNNYDNETFGENADGFAAKLTVGYGNVFDGCIAYRNSDDGWDLYAKNDSGNIGCVIIYNCVAYENGYLEYTRDEINATYPSYANFENKDKETSTNPYCTRDGDGNGFKLGGSIMEGDVVMYNCLSFQNRMHGVTDNSNPGYLKVEGVTSYDNSAAIGMDGKVISTANSDSHGNIDVARQTYSYNTVKNVLSVHSTIPKSLSNDAYRGTVTDSILNAGSKSNVVKGSIEGDTRNSGGVTNTSQIDAVDAATMFEKLPVEMSTDGEGNVTYTYNVSGANDSHSVEGGEIGAILDTRAHVAFRNADGSINMGEILAKSQAGEEMIKANLGENTTAGSTLNLGSWDEYTHFYESDLADTEAVSEAAAIVARTIDAMTISCDEDAVYQDFDVPVAMYGATISWSSDNTDYVTFASDDVDVSLSGSQYIKAIVYRPADADVQVKITATVSYKGTDNVVVTDTKDFTLNVKAGDPAIGEVYVSDAEGQSAANEGRYIVDQFSVYPEPEVKVKNGLYVDSDKLLDSSLYNVETTYMYQTDATAHAVEVKGFTTSNAGVYTITNTVSLKDNSAAVGEMSYRIYVASAAAKVDFAGVATVTVYQDGYRISGEPSSATGTLYTVASPVALTNITAENIKTYEGVESYSFRDTSIEFTFDNANLAEYYIYYALANQNGAVTSEIYETKINAVSIDTAEKFMKIAGGEKIGDEIPSQTLYLLTNDIDFTGVTFTRSKSSFSGVFNGLGHTISNLTAPSQGVFYKVTGGTIMNVKFDELSITATSDKAGLVIESTGGYFYNIAFTNVNVDGAKRVAALIGHIGGTEGSTVTPTYISQISIVNDEEHVIKGTQRVAGLVGYVQNYYSTIAIDNCQVMTDIDAGSTGEGGGMVASWEDKATDVLTIEKCYYSGNLRTSAAAGSSRLGGMLGYHKGGIGTLVISQCISLATTTIQGVTIDVSVKNASPIVGNFSTAGNVTVTKCIGLREEYNTDFGVDVFTETNLKRHPEYIQSDAYLGLDTDVRWTIIEADEGSSDLYKAPYVVLNFLGDWDNV